MSVKLSGDVMMVAMEAAYCATCMMAFAVPAHLMAHRVRGGEPVYCPNGHENTYSRGDSQEERRRRLIELHEAEQAEARAVDAASTQANSLGDGAIDTHQCPKCEKRYARVLSLGKHLRDVHSVSQAEWEGLYGMICKRWRGTPK